MLPILSSRERALCLYPTPYCLFIAPVPILNGCGMRDYRMSDVFYLRPIEPPATPADVNAMALQAGGCFNLHGVDWKNSFLAEDGGRMLCWYQAPDAESVRVALRSLGSDMRAIFAGKLYKPEAALDEVNVLVELDAQQTKEAEVKQLAASSKTLRLVQEIDLSDSARKLLLLRAEIPADAVAALRALGLDPTVVWSGQMLDPQKQEA
jgi:hypothetical protein